MKDLSRYITLLLVLLTLVGLWSCSQESNSWYSRNFHNLTARDNAYHLARENMKEAELMIEQGLKDDYDVVLDIVYHYDTNQTKGYSQLQDVLKYASLPPTRHKNSDYVDRSFVLIGKALMYQGKWKDGMQAFKFVNAKGKDADARHTALIELMRGYLRLKQYKNAMAVNDVIKKELNALTEKNVRDYYLTLAQYYKEQHRYAECRKHLLQAMPYVTRRYPTARYNFILGQLDQLLEQDSAAYVHYKKTLRKNPPYILDFNTRLNMAQATATHDADAVRKTENYLKRMLKDKKNEEFKDRIYYEMGLFELKQKDEKTAIEYFNKSLRASKGNSIQQGRTYLQMAEVFDRREDYVTAKLYYDSTLSKWSTDDPEYPPIAKRHELLVEFSGYYLTVQREDSLQKIAAMDSVSRERLIDTLVARESARIKAEMLAKAQAAKSKTTVVGPAGPEPTGPTGQQQDMWYFYNQNLTATAKLDFVKKWGTRVLEDNWRRSVKEQVSTVDKDTTQNKVPSKKDSSGSIAIVVDRQQYYKDIPITPEQLTASNEKIQEGLYNMARLYNLKFNNDLKAIATYEELLRRFPSYKQTPEVLYALCFLCEAVGNKEKYDYYRNKLINEYPNSTSARMMLDPNYMVKHKKENAEASRQYKFAFDLFKSGEYQACDSLIQEIRSTWPENNIEDKLAMLEIMIDGKQKRYDEYQKGLEEFIKKYPDSPLVPRAEEQLQNATKMSSNSTSTTNPQIPNPVAPTNTVPAPVSPGNTPYPFPQNPPAQGQ